MEKSTRLPSYLLILSILFFADLTLSHAQNTWTQKADFGQPHFKFKAENLSFITFEEGCLNYDLFDCMNTVIKQEYPLSELTGKIIGCAKEVV